MKKLKDIFTKGNVGRLPVEWQEAFAAAKNVSNPLRDLEHTRHDKARAAFVVIAMGDKTDLAHVMSKPLVRAFIKELKDYR